MVSVVKVTWHIGVVSLPMVCMIVSKVYKSMICILQIFTRANHDFVFKTGLKNIQIVAPNGGKLKQQLTVLLVNRVNRLWSYNDLSN